MTRLPPPPILEWRELSYWGGRADAWAAARDAQNTRLETMIAEARQ